MIKAVSSGVDRDLRYFFRPDKNLASYDRIYAALFRRFPEFHDAVHKATVRYRHSGLAEPRDLISQSVNTARPVEQAVFGVYVQIYKFVSSHVRLPSSLSCPRSRLSS